MVRVVLEKSVEYVAAFLLTAMTVLVLLQVLFRYWLHLPLDWGEELSRYLFIWSAMLGAGIATKRGAHFGIDYLVKGLPPILRKSIAIAISGCVCALLGVIAVQGTRLAILNLSQISPTLAIPMGVPYAAVPICAVLMLIYTVAESWAIFTGAKALEGS